MKLVLFVQKTTLTVINFESSLVPMVRAFENVSLQFFILLTSSPFSLSAYHTKCIDPWLTRNRRVCPVCKRRVIAKGEKLSELDSDSDDETRPLLSPGARNSSGGTFSDSVNKINLKKREVDWVLYITPIWIYSNIGSKQQRVSSNGRRYTQRFS